MKALSLLALAATSAAFLDKDLIHKVNSNPASTWKAGINHVFAGVPLEQIKAKLLPINATVPSPKRRPDPNMDSKVSIPDSFDARSEWARCRSISEVRNQGECGSCWAFAAVEAFTDRYCIESGQKENPSFSAYYLTTCDESSDGCNGGSLSSAWEFISENGLPTTECQPYNIPTCKPEDQPCLPPFVATPNCPGQRCTASGQDWSVKKARNVYSPGCGFFSCDANKMAADLVAHGPFEVSMEVYSDFVHYKSGVYKHTGGQLLGGHAIKIVGYGTEAGTPFWLIANSWTTTWGDKGFFKIVRGQNEVGIESNTQAGYAAAFQ